MTIAECDAVLDATREAYLDAELAGDRDRARLLLGGLMALVETRVHLPQQRTC